ncbi:type III secretion system export apparatus subunit SctR [Thalassomonas actiniarum]|uniref:Type III secretion system export apparatus subunit SctR n=1 Tax=Thalassomonas actiniarum TaxID=485447 RepID=A0AAF0C1D0_9GAMM|nr:type III secretion system export apparatus subunit SctR [Thalassomonas actiniarum]WDD96640.1 type III secretion system export apparatus subunit SctR [Thalassomonas actiniarum]
MNNLPDPIYLIAGLSLLALVPFAAVMLTSFVKIAVVLSLIRNALGVQQIPPNIALYGLSIIMSIFIMAPIGYQIADIVEQNPASLESSEGIKSVVEQSMVPLKVFLKKHASEDEAAFFLETAGQLWPEDISEKVTEDDLLIVIPTFVVSELTSAFQIGFLIYLPFIVIDLIISNVLLALGMMMVSPMTISLPFKLLLFVLVDGWANLLHSLVLSYQ